MKKISFKVLIGMLFLFFLNIYSPMTFMALANNANTELNNISEERIYHVGVLTLTHPIVIYRQYLPFLDYINAHLDWEFELVLYKEYSEVIEAIKDAELDMALLAGSSFVEAKELVDLEPLVAVLSDENRPETFSIIVAKEDNESVNSLEDLRGMSIVFGPEQSTSSYLMPLYFLEENNIFLNDFSEYGMLNNHDAVARAVLRGDYDAGAMGETFARRFLGQGLKTVATTDTFPGFLLVARNGVPIEVQEAMTEFLLNIQAQDTEFIEISSEWPEILRHGFAPIIEESYDVFKVLQEHIHTEYN